ncbi:MAG TPA: hypothetical protein VF260_12860 [Bacilli bacterium]
MSYKNSPHIPPSDDPAYYGHTSSFGDSPYGAYPEYPANQAHAGGQNLPVLYQQQPVQPGGGLFSNLPIKDLKSFIDRMGGLDGILASLTKIQKLFATFQSMAPMLKLLAGSLGGKAATAGESDGLSRKLMRRRPHRRKRRNVQNRRKKTSVRKSTVTRGNSGNR